MRLTPSRPILSLALLGALLWDAASAVGDSPLSPGVIPSGSGFPTVPALPPPNLGLPGNTALPPGPELNGPTLPAGLPVPAGGMPAPGVLTSPPGPVLSATTGAPLVIDVQIVGNDAVREDKVQSYLRTRRSREFDPELVKGDVRRLASSGLFRDVRTYTKEVPGGVVVTFEVFERPTIREIKFIGNKRLTDSILKKQSGLQKSEALNLYSVEEARNRLEDYYHSKGYSKAVVSILEGRNAGDRDVVFEISEGPLVRISSVDFVGNTIASDERLKTQIQSKPGFLYYLFRGRLEKNKVQEDEDKLMAYYRSLGFFRARIGRELQYDDSGEWAKLLFVIDEGPRYVVRSVTVNGNSIFSSPDLVGQLELKSGEYFNQGKMNRDVGALRDTYGSQGYIFADIKADPRFREEPGELDLVYGVSEGQQFRVGKINIHIAGEYPHTRDSVILNRLSLRPGDIIDIREVRASERRLKSAQLFEDESTGGQAPRIVIRPPSLEAAAGLATQPQGGGTYRGQSPSAQPTAFRGQSPDGAETPTSSAVMDLDVSTPRLRNP